MYCKTCATEKCSDDFYVSNKSRCKECIKSAVKQNRLKNIEHYRLIDKERGMRQDRVAARKEYRRTPKGRLAVARTHKKWNVSNAIRRQANVAVGNAVRDGRLEKLPCIVCGAAAEAHHPDYSRPLDVIWLCVKHHREAHAIVKELEEA